MSWTAIIPFKGNVARKTRLAGILSSQQRIQFSERMFNHVCSVLADCDAIAEIAVLSDILPPEWKGHLIRDQGRGLNAELTDAACEMSVQRLLIIHADLPLLNRGDIASLLAEAERAGVALAPDRFAVGTNALALVDPVGFDFQFGPDSMKLHSDACEGRARIVMSTGLSFDIDTPDDYLEACRVTPETIRMLVAEYCCAS